MEKLPRFSYQIPSDLTGVFVDEMKTDRRETPSDLLTAIIRKHFEEKVRAAVVARLQESHSDEEIPAYHTRHTGSEVEPDVRRKGNRE